MARVKRSVHAKKKRRETLASAKGYTGSRRVRYRAAKEQVQPSLDEHEDPGWAQALVRRTADTMAASTFHAIANSRCRVCPVRTSCPISGKGRQVTDES